MALDKVTVGVLADNAVSTAKVADDAVTGAKIENNPTVAGNLTVSGTSTLTGNTTASGNVTVAGDFVPSEPLSNRNMIINGGMQVWQRATSAVTATTTYDTADRWRFYDPSSGSFTSEKHTMSAAELNTTGHRNALKLACTGVSSAGSGDHAYFYQALEGQDCQKLQYGTANAKSVTISFWVKSSITGTYCISVYADAATNYQVAKEYTISSADTWEYKTITITPTEGSTSLITSSGGLFDNNTSQAFLLYFFLVSGSAIEGTANEWGTGGTRYATSNQVNWLSNTSNTFYITGIQLEVGSNATPFEHRMYGDELARCQRYYQRIGDGWRACIGSGSVGAWGCQLPVPISMRATPTMTATTTWYHTTYNTYTNTAHTTLALSSIEYEEGWGCLRYNIGSCSSGSYHDNYIGALYNDSDVILSAEL